MRARHKSKKEILCQIHRSKKTFHCLQVFCFDCIRHCLCAQALDLTHGDDLAYLWKTATVMGGIYLFFVLERVMKIIDVRRQVGFRHH